MRIQLGEVVETGDVGAFSSVRSRTQQQRRPLLEVVDGDGRTSTRGPSAVHTKAGYHDPSDGKCASAWSYATRDSARRTFLAIAQAIYFGAKVLIPDEPTAALGVKQSGVVLKYVARAAHSGLGVVFITHNPHHAFVVGDHFVILELGEMSLDAARGEITVDQLTEQMAGGDELAESAHEMRDGA